MTPDQVRGQLIGFAESRRSRRTDFVKGMPSKWAPTTVTDPRSRQAFTEEGAWEYIVEQLKSGVEIYKMELTHPPGKTGYYFLLPSINLKNIYVKLQIFGDHVRGRSFHYERDRD